MRRRRQLRMASNIAQARTSTRAVGGRRLDVEIQICAAAGLDVYDDRGLVAQKERRLAFRKRLHSLQLSLDRPRSYLRRAERIANHLELFLGLGENVAERSELGFYRRQQPPDFAGASLDRKRP